jgi:hypothetical protein
LATRFADGRLSNQNLLVANDNELFELLTAVYGIGKVSPSTYFTLSADWKIVFSSSGLVSWPSFFREAMLNQHSRDVCHLLFAAPRHSACWYVS